MLQSTLSAEFWKSIRGQTTTLPNLYLLFPNWEPRLHPEYLRARDEVFNPWIERWVANKATSRKFQKADFAFFAAIQCADASFDKLCTIAKHFAWYFIWDDLFDCGPLADDKSKLDSYRDASLQYLRAALCEKGEYPDLSCFSQQLQDSLRCWDEVAAHLREVCTRGTCHDFQFLNIQLAVVVHSNNTAETREELLNKHLFYASSMGVVDSVFAGGVPSLTKFWRRRERTAGVYSVIATIPFTYGIDISKQELSFDLMRLLWRHTSYLVHMTNDMSSLQKEIGDNQAESLVPVLMLNEGIDCDAAMRLAHQLVEESTRGFHEVEARMQCMSQRSPNPVYDAYLEGCRNVVMGLIHFILGNATSISRISALIM
ncbi:terpenoid synthase [Aspergillus avenaceus]|uniref:Terpenoid synthase n=1 Tax=Aspergillus avenaceus TaxID=36643 RepID=A0A5N6U023_ASPAV|nr:terpenoid synthase [Aspergillus avenaceus]